MGALLDWGKERKLEDMQALLHPLRMAHGGRNVWHVSAATNIALTASAPLAWVDSGNRTR